MLDSFVTVLWSMFSFTFCWLWFYNMFWRVFLAGCVMRYVLVSLPVSYIIGVGLMAGLFLVVGC